MLLSLATLIGSTILLGAVAGPVLARSAWATTRPTTAVACWTAALAGSVLAVAGVVALGLLSSPGPWHDVVELLRQCLDGHRHEGMTVATLASLGALLFAAPRVAGAVRRLHRATGHRRRHRELLDLIARTDERHVDVLVLDHPLPVAYCLPARVRPIVVSSGARTELSREQFEAVLAHERAHLRHRHHLVLVFLDLVSAVLPWAPTVRHAARCLPPLLEMSADDAAARRCGPDAVAGALRRLTPMPGGPAGALAATNGGTALARRLSRLTGQDGGGAVARRRVLAVRSTAVLFVAAAVAAPIALTMTMVARFAAFC